MEAIFTPSLAILSAWIIELDINGVFYLYISLCALACILVIPLKIPRDIKKIDSESSTNIQ